MKPYQHLPILEAGEPLVAIPAEPFVLAQPHPYQALGAPYGGVSPFYVRQEVLRALHQAHLHLQAHHPGWRILIFDAYRPVAVQQFMVDYTFAEAAQALGLDPANLIPKQRQALLEQVYQIWAIPSHDPKTPPPHSTGAAVDITLVDQQGKAVEMGSPIDELSGRSQPDYFAQIAADPHRSSEERQQAALVDTHRQLLKQVMRAAGFQRHPGEWWHFCRGDQMWAWLMQQQNPRTTVTACYGRVEL